MNKMNEKIGNFLYGKYWKEHLTALIFGLWGLAYNQFVIMRYYDAGKTYGFVELISDRWIGILLQGYIIGILSVYLCIIIYKKF